MTTEITKTKPNTLTKTKPSTLTKTFGEGFNNIKEAMEFAKIVAESKFAPKEMEHKPNEIFLSMHMGAEIGLKPIQSIQNINVINGKPSLWGDAALAIVKNHRDYEHCNEYLEENDTVAICEIKRKGEPLKKVKFSIKNAERAGLLTDRTNGFSSWKKYPERMLQMRARGFALRDSFPDALKGLVTSEEAEDYKIYDQDAESEEDQDIEAEKHIGEVASPDQLEEFYKLCEISMVDQELKQKWLDKAGVSTFEDINRIYMEKLIDHLKTKIQ